jgi:hypothetical protein
MRYLMIPLFTVLASPAMAATGPFFSLRNTNFIVLLAFILFIAILMYMKIPAKIGAMLDARADGIRSDLESRLTASSPTPAPKQSVLRRSLRTTSLHPSPAVWQALKSSWKAPALPPSRTCRTVL